MPAFAVDCRHLPETVGIFIITWACSSWRLLTFTGNYRHSPETLWHLPETAGTCLIICAGICRKMAALTETIAICRSMFTGVQLRFKGLIICVGNCQRWPVFAWDSRHLSCQIFQYLPQTAGTCRKQSMLEFSGLERILTGLIICVGICRKMGVMPENVNIFLGSFSSK